MINDTKNIINLKSNVTNEYLIGQVSEIQSLLHCSYLTLSYKVVRPLLFLLHIYKWLLKMFDLQTKASDIHINSRVYVFVYLECRQFEYENKNDVISNSVVY